VHESGGQRIGFLGGGAMAQVSIIPVNYLT
jgi:hypothetical protein